MLQEEKPVKPVRPAMIREEGSISYCKQPSTSSSLSTTRRNKDGEMSTVKEEAQQPRRKRSFAKQAMMQLAAGGSAGKRDGKLKR